MIFFESTGSRQMQHENIEDDTAPNVANIIW